jgi:hypothetical protein
MRWPPAWELVQCREVKSWLVSELVRELQFSRCEMLLVETGSGVTGIVREPRVRGTSAVGSRYRTTTGEDTTNRRLRACCSELLSV